MMDWISDHAELVFGIVLVVLFGLIVLGTYYEDADWSRYAVAHHCEVKGHASARNGFGVGSNGQAVVTYIPGQTIYVCDGGEIISR